MLLLKNILFIVVALYLALSSYSLYSQSTVINEISIVPESPTDLDSITIFVDQSFPSSSCDLFQKNLSVNGNSITSSAHHCIGMLSAICNSIDTFYLAPLQGGIYNLSHSVSFGAFPEPCNSGIVQDEIGYFQFEVTNTSLNHISKSIKDFKIYPNPTNGDIFIQNYNLNESLNVAILNLQGAPLINSRSNHVSLQSLKKGIYILRVSQINRVKQIIVVKR